jgi:hypothetical protein
MWHLIFRSIHWEFLDDIHTRLKHRIACGWVSAKQ